MKSNTYRNEESLYGLLPTNSIFDGYLRKIFTAFEENECDPNVIFKRLVTDYFEEAKQQKPISRSPIPFTMDGKPVVEEEKSWYQRIGSFWTRTYAYYELAEKFENTLLPATMVNPHGLLAIEFLNLLNAYDNWKEKNDNFIQLLNAFFSVFPHNLEHLTNTQCKNLLVTNDIHNVYFRNVISTHINKIIQTKPYFISADDFTLIKMANKTSEVVTGLIENITAKKDNLYFIPYRSLFRATEVITEEQANTLLPALENDLTNSNGRDAYLTADAFAVLAHMIEKINAANMPANLLMHLKQGLKNRMTYYATLAIASKLLLLESNVMSDPQFNCQVLKEILTYPPNKNNIPELYSDKNIHALFDDGLEVLTNILYKTQQKYIRDYILELLTELLDREVIPTQVLNAFIKIVKRGSEDQAEINTFIENQKQKINARLENITDGDAIEKYSGYMYFVSASQVSSAVLPLIKRLLTSDDINIKHQAFILLSALFDLDNTVFDKTTFAKEFLPQLLPLFTKLNSAASVVIKILAFLNPQDISDSILPKILAEQTLAFGSTHPTLDNRRLLTLLTSIVPYLDVKVVENLLWPNVKKDINLEFIPSATPALNLLEAVITKSSANLRLKEILPWLLDKFVQHPGGPSLRFVNCISNGLNYSEQVCIAFKILTANEPKLTPFNPYMLAHIYQHNQDLKTMKDCYNSLEFKNNSCIIH